MPTASKLFASAAFALLGFLIAQSIVPVLPEGTQVGLFRQICAFIGLMCGWFVMGRLTRRGYRASLESGVRTVLYMVFWGLFFFANYEMKGILSPKSVLSARQLFVFIAKN